jgi:hypothetical protein
MDNDNYVVIQGWMCNELKLSGNELLVFALIYGFSQDGESEFSGSRTYVSKTFNISKPTVDKAIKSLILKGLIQKRVTYLNDIQINKYKASLQGVKKLYGDSKETLQGGSKETLPYNNKYIKNYSNNIELDKAIKDFIDVRKKMKKPMTDRAIELFIKRLQSFEKTEQGQIDIINTAIERGWMTVYPKKEEKHKATSSDDILLSDIERIALRR